MSQDDNINRREVVKTIAAGSAAAVGASGIAAGETGTEYDDTVSDDVAARYGAADAASEVLAQHRDDVESMLGEAFADAFEAAAVDEVVVGDPVDLDVGAGDDVAVLSSVDTGIGRSAAIHVYLDIDGEADARITALPEKGTTRYSVWGPGDALDEVMEADYSTTECTYCCGCSCCGCWWGCCSDTCCYSVPDSSCEEQSYCCL